MNPFLQATRPGARAEYWESRAKGTTDTKFLVKTIDEIWMQLLEVHIADLARFYGDEAPIVEVARLSLSAKQRMRKLEDETEGDAEASLEEMLSSLSVESTTREKDLLVENVNKLLKWAELPTRSREDIIRE